MFEFYQKVSQTQVASFETMLENDYKKKTDAYLCAIIKSYWTEWYLFIHLKRFEHRRAVSKKRRNGVNCTPPGGGGGGKKIILDINEDDNDSCTSAVA